MRVAEGLTPTPAPPRAVYREQTSASRDGSRLVAGPAESFATPSVTYLSDADLFLVRSQAGWFAFINEDPHLGHPTAWDEATQLFRSPAHGETYDWRGHCVAGPCPRGLDRHPVDIRDGQALVDTSNRLRGPAQPEATPAASVTRLRHAILHWLGFAPPEPPGAPPAKPAWS